MSDPFELEDTPPQGRDVEPHYLTGLNAPQRDAVLATEGPVLVLAGAGSGKTRVLTTRLAHLVATARARPHELLCVTFTNKAAKEMQHRIGAILGQAVEGMPWLGTFHSVAAKILRRHAELAGLESNFTILDADDQTRLLKQILREENIDDKRWPPRLLASLIDGWKNRALAPAQLSPRDAGNFANGQGPALYAKYQARLVQLNACDFGDLLMHNLHLFQKNAELLAQYQQRIRYILVDEYQDTNVAQYLWLRLLAQKHKNICCVGDDDQSIYGWRGAEVGNILRFEKDFPGARVIRLEQNYRSTKNILAAASGLITANQGRLGKTLWSEGAAGEKVIIHGVWDHEAEATHVSREIENLLAQGENLNEVAVLLRTSSQMRSFEDRFIAMALPYRVIGGPRFYERREIRDALAYLRVVAQPRDDLAFERIFNTPKRGLGDKTLASVRLLGLRQGIPLLAAAEKLAESDELAARARNMLTKLVSDFKAWRERLDDGEHAALAEVILEESGYLPFWRQEKTPDAEGRVENLGELIKAIAEFENMFEFLEHVSLVMENTQGASGERVSIMTLHAAKGLEFNHVYLAGWEEGLFPNQRALDEKGLEALEEERRLAYVGITRARKCAHIYYAANRLLHGRWQTSLPSRFIDELPDEAVERVADHGLMTGGTHMTAHRGWKDISDNRDDGFVIGGRVFHEKFGYGHVVEVEGDRLLVNFDKAGQKRVLDSYLRAA